MNKFFIVSCCLSFVKCSSNICQVFVKFSSNAIHHCFQSVLSCGKFVICSLSFVICIPLFVICYFHLPFVICHKLVFIFTVFCQLLFLISCVFEKQHFRRVDLGGRAGERGKSCGKLEPLMDGGCQNMHNALCPLFNKGSLPCKEKVIFWTLPILLVRQSFAIEQCVHTYCNVSS